MNMADPDQAHHEAMLETGFWGRRGAGCVVYARSTGRYLIQLRSVEVLQALTWGVWGGAVDLGHTPEECVIAELDQETGYKGAVDLHFLVDYVDAVSGFTYSNFLAVVEDEFTPILNWEGYDAAWFEAGQWPQPLHFGLAYLLESFPDPVSAVSGTSSSSPAPSR